MCLTPGAWSDWKSQWFPSLILAPFSLALCVMTHRIYIRAGAAPKIQAIVLWFLFGGVFTDSICTLIVAQRFLNEYGGPGPLDYICHPSLFFNLPWGNF